MPQPVSIVASHCTLGEGPLWANDRLWWCDITPMKLMSCRADGSDFRTVQFSEMISAIARLADGRLLIASESALFRYDPATGTRENVIALEAEDLGNRSNDGRADRQGGLWIGTMAKSEAPGHASFYRYAHGTLRTLWTQRHIPNAQCFSPDGKIAYLADTTTHQIMRWELDAQGWPQGQMQVFADFTADKLYPDGAVTDAEGGVWCAFYGDSSVRRIDPDGNQTDLVRMPASQVTCPAFGGDDFRTLFVTSARQNMTAAQLLAEPQAGDIFAFRTTIPGLPEPFVDA